jgi:hypothetical protein
MSDQRISDYLRTWGFDCDTFEKRAKESFQSARGDLSEASDALRSTLGEARKIIVNLKQTGGPAATELKTGLEQAWDAIEAAFGRAKERVREQPQAPEPPSPPTDATPDA